MNHSFQRIVGLAIAALCFLVAEHVGGNGFIAAFAGGLTLGNTARDYCSCLYDFLEAEGQLLMLGVFLLLGCTLAWPAIEAATEIIASNRSALAGW